MKHVFVFDPKSFHDQQWKMDGIRDSIGQYFRTRENPDFSIQLSRYPRNAIVLIQKQVNEAKEGDTVRVYAIGGEEIFFDCLNGVAGLPNVELAVVPYGDLIDFLCVFGEAKAEFFTDIPSLVESEAIPTDLIDAGYDYAFNTCFVGFVSAATIRTRKIIKMLGKGLSGFSPINKLFTSLSMLNAAFDKQIVDRHYRVTIDGKEYDGNYSLINIANGPFFNGKKTAAAQAMPDDGWLDVALITSGGPFKTLRSVKKYTRGKAPSNCNKIRAKKITVQSDIPVWIQLDCEFLQDTNITFEVIPGAIRFVAGANLTYHPL
jgi:diacylglycerol kinase family enzyme